MGGAGVVPTHLAGCCEVPNEECHPRSSLLRGGRGYWGPSPGSNGGGGDGPGTTLRARSVWHCQPSLYQDLADCRLLANKGEIYLILQ